jgi:hypothetical protein
LAPCDPLDRTATKTDNAGQAGEKTTGFDHLGLSDDGVSETVAGQLRRVLPLLVTFKAGQRHEP